MIRPDCRLSAKPSALSRHRYFVSHCAPSNYKKVVSADTPNPCTQPTRRSCNNLISNLLQNPGVGRHHTNLHSADTVSAPFALSLPRSPSLVSPASIEDLPRSFLVLLGLTGDLLRSPSRLSKLDRESPQVVPPSSSLPRSGISLGRPPSSSPPRLRISLGRPTLSSLT